MNFLKRIYGSADLKDIRKKVISASPVIAFFLFLFCTIIGLFGVKYIMVVTVATVAFKVNYKKKQPWTRILGSAALLLFLCVPAYIAVLNLPLRIVLNFSVPFCLIFLKTNQFNKLAYFSELMAFVFLQLMPLSTEEFMIQTAAYVYSLICFLLCTWIYHISHPRTTDYDREKKGLFVCAQWLESCIENREDKEAEMTLYQLSQKLYQDAYMRRGRKGIVDLDGRVNYIFALTFQRVAYFIDSGQRVRWSEEGKILDREKEYACSCVEFLKDASGCNFWEDNHRERLYARGKTLLNRGEEQDSEFYVGMQSFIRPFLIVLDTLKQDTEGEEGSGWKLPPYRRTIAQIWGRLQLDTFEFRFAMRMSVVLALTFAYSVISSEQHAYWLPLNAFLLLRPMYEDSRYRLKTRFTGTVAGCAVMAVIYPLLPGYPGHLLLAGVMAACMYTATPGTTAHAVFVTCFSLSMVTLAMGEMAAIELRILYVIGAVLIVLLINRFFFATSIGQQFRCNVQQIFHMHQVYLRLLKQSLHAPLDYGIICDAQIQYHMIHGQIREYIEKTDSVQKELSRTFLGISWRMISEMEQLLFLTNIRKRGKESRKMIEDYIDYSAYILDQVCQRLQIRRRKPVLFVPDARYHRTVPGEQELTYLMTGYAKNLSRLYRLVCENTAVSGGRNSFLS